MRYCVRGGDGEKMSCCKCVSSSCDKSPPLLCGTNRCVAILLLLHRLQYVRVCRSEAADSKVNNNVAFVRGRGGRRLLLCSLFSTEIGCALIIPPPPPAASNETKVPPPPLCHSCVCERAATHDENPPVSQNLSTAATCAPIYSNSTSQISDRRGGEKITALCSVFRRKREEEQGKGG